MLGKQITLKGDYLFNLINELKQNAIKLFEGQTNVGEN